MSTSRYAGARIDWQILVMLPSSQTCSEPASNRVLQKTRWMLWGRFSTIVCDSVGGSSRHSIHSSNGPNAMGRESPPSDTALEAAESSNWPVLALPYWESSHCTAF